MKQKERLDLFLVEQGLFESQQKAAAHILAGNVLVNETPLFKAGTLIAKDSVIRVKAKLPYVGRGALKLLHALSFFQIDVKGKTAIDVGSSTGGFTEALLEQGVKLVYALDVGTNQLDWKLRSDTRVIVMENTNARFIDSITFDPKPEIAAVDVSFISLTKILSPLTKIMRQNFQIITLIKPQFELEKSKIGPKGLVKEEFRLEAVNQVIDFARSIGLKSSEVVPSPISGAKSGNTEFLVVFTA